MASRKKPSQEDLMASRKKPSQEDIDLFRRSVGATRQVNHDKTTRFQKRPSPRPRVRPDFEEAPGEPGFSDGFDIGTVASDETLFFSRPGLQQRQLQRLRRGQLPIGDELDMHGMTTAVARNAIILPSAATGIFAAYVSFMARAMDREVMPRS
jgi:DNA-nicking Smr family endonuclease